MRRKLALVFPLVLFLCSAVFAQNWSGILDPSRAIDWSKAGVPGGIPTNRTQCGSTINSPGSGDATSTIQNALNSCGSGHFVLLGSGTFVINSFLTIPSNVTLRGSGANKTKLDLRGSGQDSAIRFGTSNRSSEWPIDSGTKTSITGSPAKGATQITVSSTSGISTGTMLMLTQGNSSFMTEAGHGGTCSWCNGGYGGDSGQVVRVTGMSGNTLTIDPPLYQAYSNSSPTAYVFKRAAVVGAGLEDLKLSGNNTGYTVLILMLGAYGSWVKGVENDFADNAHMFMYYDTHCEVRDSFFHDGYNHGPGGTDNQLTLGYKSSANLIINNIFWRQHVSIMFEWGSAGNVVAYNYLDGNYHQTQLTWHQSDIDFHGAHPMFNLLEGNSGNFVQIDDYWGSSSHTTIFRNYARGAHQYIPPMNARGALQTGSAQWEDGGNNFAYDINDLQTYTNLVGVIAGSSHTTSQGYSGIKVSPTSASNRVCIRFGFDGSNNAPVSNSSTYSTSFLHGVYDCQAGTVNWNSGLSNHTLPASFFLSSKPSWFGDAAWPPIGPDVTGGSGIGGHAQVIPAQACFNTTTNNGSSNTGAFSAATCYGSGGGGGGGGSTDIAPPTNMSATVT